MNANTADPQATSQKSASHRLFRTCACCQSNALPANPARRRLLAGGIAALGLGAPALSLGAPALGLGASAVWSDSAAAQTPEAKTRIDVHHHYEPPIQVEAMARRRSGRAPDWSLQLSLDDMDRAGVRAAVLSLVPPGVWFGDVEEARTLARACNEYGAQLVRDHPRRFGLFATLPLPDVEASLREIEYALDVIKADGIGLFTSYGDKYLGDADFMPVFEELSRRKAVVYTHPLVPACCGHMTYGMGPSSLEFATDTTRTIASLIFGKAGTAFRCPDVQFIWSHSGGTLPFLIGRFIREQEVRKDPRMPDGPVPIVRKYFYEVAQGNTPEQLAALLQLIPVSQVMFGSDFPYRGAIEAADGLAAHRFSPADLAAIDHGNALRLLPRLAG